MTMDLSPKTAWVIRDGVEVEVPAEAIRRQADISRVVAGVLPAEKEGEITRLREARRGKSPA